MTDDLNGKLIGIPHKPTGQANIKPVKDSATPALTGAPTIDAYAVEAASHLVGVDKNFHFQLPKGAKIIDFFIGPGNRPYVWAAAFSMRELVRHDVFILQSGQEVPTDCDITRKLGGATLMNPQGMALYLAIFERGDWTAQGLNQ